MEEVIDLGEDSPSPARVVHELYITGYMHWAVLRDDNFTDSHAYPELTPKGLLYEYQPVQAEIEVITEASLPAVTPAPRSVERERGSSPTAERLGPEQLRERRRGR